LTRLKQRSSFQQSSIATSRENEDLSTAANDDVTSAPKTLTFGSGNKVDKNLYQQVPGEESIICAANTTLST